MNYDHEAGVRISLPDVVHGTCEGEARPGQARVGGMGLVGEEERRGEADGDYKAK